MKGPIFLRTKDGFSDTGIHTPILDAVNYKKTKAFLTTKKRAEKTGLTPHQIKKFLGA